MIHDMTDSNGRDCPFGITVVPRLLLLLLVLSGIQHTAVGVRAYNETMKPENQTTYMFDYPLIASIEGSLTPSSPTAEGTPVPLPETVVLPLPEGIGSLPQGVGMNVSVASAAADSVDVSAAAARSSGADRQYGILQYPFTTQGAFAEGTSTPTNLFPWSPTGRLTYAGGSYCSASLIAPGVVVTAAHCIALFGTYTKLYPGLLAFEPASYDGTAPYGKYYVSKAFVPTTYLAGTDPCEPQAPGVVCANDMAVLEVRMYNGSYPGEIVGYYDYVNSSDYSVGSYAGLKAVQMTVLGYPGRLSCLFDASWSCQIGSAIIIAVIVIGCAIIIAVIVIGSAIIIAVIVIGSAIIIAVIGSCRSIVICSDIVVIICVCMLEHCLLCCAGNIGQGERMIRTDALGLLSTYSQYTIGSSMRAGSSGGPYLVNFGVTPNYTNAVGQDAAMKLVAVTSWGYAKEGYDVQGSSRFGTNSVYTSKTNIQSLVDSLCASIPDPTLRTRIAADRCSSG